MYNETLKLDLPDRVLDFTEGKRALICGGQNSHEKERARLRKIFEFQNLEWVTTERSEEAPIKGASKRIENGSYDVVFFLTHFASHAHQRLIIPAAKKQQTPVVQIPSGYSPQAFSKAIDEQVCRNLERQQLARSSSQTMNYANSGRPVTY